VLLYLRREMLVAAYAMVHEYTEHTEQTRAVWE
jgi:hypothetical protein